MKRTLAALIVDAVNSGRTRKALASTLGISRQQFYRLENGEQQESSKAGRSLRALLEGTEPLGQQLIGAVNRVVSGDRAKAVLMLQMLHAIEAFESNPSSGKRQKRR